MRNILIALFVLALSACATTGEPVTQETQEANLDIRMSLIVDEYVFRLERANFPVRFYFQVHTQMLMAHIGCIGHEVLKFNNSEEGLEFSEFNYDEIWGTKAFALESHLFAYVKAASIVFSGPEPQDAQDIVDTFYENYNTSLQTFIIEYEDLDEEAFNQVGRGCALFYDVLKRTDEGITDAIVTGTQPATKWEKWVAE